MKGKKAQRQVKYVNSGRSRSVSRSRGSSESHGDATSLQLNAMNFPRLGSPPVHITGDMFNVPGRTASNGTGDSQTKDTSAGTILFCINLFKFILYESNTVMYP